MSTWKQSDQSNPYCARCGKTWDAHLCDGRQSCPPRNLARERMHDAAPAMLAFLLEMQKHYTLLGERNVVLDALIEKATLPRPWEPAP